MTGPLLTPEKVAEALGVSLAMVYKIIRQGLLPVVRIGTAVRVIPQDLSAYIEANRSTAPRAPSKRLSHQSTAGQRQRFRTRQNSPSTTPESTTTLETELEASR